MSKFLSIRLLFVLILSGMLVSLTGCGSAKSSGGEPPSYSPARILVPEAPGSQTLGSSPLILDIPIRLRDTSLHSPIPVIPV